MTNFFIAAENHLVKRILQVPLCATMLGFLLSSCVPPEEGVSTAVPDAPVSEEVDIDSSNVTQDIEVNFETVDVIETPEPTPWEYLKNATIEEPTSNLLLAADALVGQERIQEANDILALLSETQLEPPHSIEHVLIAARIDQSRSEHKKALRILAALATDDTPLSQDQHVRLLRMKATSYAATEDYVGSAGALIELHQELTDAEERVSVGHLIWSVLRRISFEELTMALNDSSDPVQQEWFKLALSAFIVLHDPYQHGQAIKNWAKSNPNHPAAELISTGLLPEVNIATAYLRRVALVMPLTSSSADAAHAFVEGVSAQHAADSNPWKPELEIYDTGSTPELVTSYYDQAANSGADFVIGPIGVKQVETMVSHGNFSTPTILLGDSGEAELPDYVIQFALAPEQEGAGVAQRAYRSSHEYAIILHPPTRWGTRTAEGFVAEWTRLGGKTVETLEYGLNESDYSQLTKSLLNVEASAERYGFVRALAGRSLKFTPRRRQDVDFIFLVADPVHGRLIKPHIDFLQAHDLPVYSTWRVFNGQPNPINDSDLNNIEFSDMPWLVENSDALKMLRKQINTPWQNPGQLDRLFAMGVDSYNLIYRTSMLRDVPGTHYHGMTSTAHLDARNRLIRDSAWVVFADGVPQLLPDIFLEDAPRSVRHLRPPNLPALLEQR